MKKTTIYLLLINFTILMIPISYHINNVQKAHISIDNIKPYVNYELFNPALEYRIVEVKKDNYQILFNNMTSKNIEALYYLMETPLSEDELRIDLITKNIYDSIPKKETLLRHNEKELNYYKQTGNIIYRKLIIYKQPNIT